MYVCVRALLFGDARSCAQGYVCVVWGARVWMRGACVRAERDSIWVSVVKGNRTTAAAKALRFQLCAVIIRLIFSIGCCRLFVLARSGATRCTFRWRSEILESWKLNLKFARYFHVFAFAMPLLKMCALMQYPLFHKCFNVGVFGNAARFLVILLWRTLKWLWKKAF